MSSVSKSRTRRKKLAASNTDEVWVGLDVHKKSIHVGVWMNGKIVATWVAPYNADRIVKMLEPLRLGLKWVVYEAGPTGYGLVRTLRAAALPADVIAPGKTPRPPGRITKSDRLDCRKLAELAAKDLLTPITVPTPTEEINRQLVRTRNQLVKKRRRIKQQIHSFFLQYGLAEPQGLKYWSNRAMRELRRMKLCEQLRFCLDVLVDELEHLNRQVTSATQQLLRLESQAPHAELIAKLRTHGGVGPIVAGEFYFELYQPKRFETAGQVSQYIGLSPQVRSSGQTRHEGPITKTGRGTVRAMLVQASWRWIRKDPGALAVYNRLVHNTGNGKKAIVAMARHMAIDLWRMLTDDKLNQQTAA